MLSVVETADTKIWIYYKIAIKGRVAEVVYVVT